MNERAVACILRKAADRRGELDIFFILRASFKKSHRWSGQVGFPGGHLEAGETLEQAVSRECREEVGFNLDRPGFPFIEHQPFLARLSVEQCSDTLTLQ